MQKRDILEAISRVENYLYEKYSVEVHYEPGADNAYYDSLERIEIDSYQNYLYRLYTLLHEAGHVLVRHGLRSPYSTFELRFPNMKFADRSSRGNLSHRIDVLREEVLAWEAAATIAEMLDIKVDNSKLDTHRNKCIKSYVDWI